MLAWKVCIAAAMTALLTATVARAEDPTGVGTVDLVLVNDVMTMRSEYWLGVFASRPSPALQAQLKLAKNQGLLIEAVQPDSPAAKAGLRQYDVLLKGNDKPLTALRDLMHLIDQVKEGKLTLELLRAGKHETVTVTPAKRPASEPETNEWSVSEGTGTINWPGGLPLDFHIVHPGQILPPGGPLPGFPGGGPTGLDITVQIKTKLADGSKVEIIRHGGEPARVVVTRDKDKWEGTSGDLSKIPEKIRPEVQRLLHPAFDHFHAFTVPGGAVLPPAFSGQFKAPSDVEKRLADLQKQLDELRRSVDALRKDGSGSDK